MVLADLGRKLTTALSKLNEASVIDDDVIKAVVGKIQLALVQSDVALPLAKRVGDGIRKEAAEAAKGGGAAVNMRRLLHNAVIRALMELLDPGKPTFKPKKGQCNVVLLVGLQGNGKTTTAVKLAHFWRRQGWRVALVCADTYRAGAYSQLSQNAAKARIPFFGNLEESDPAVVAREGVERFRKEKFEIVVVDTSGRHAQSSELFVEMEAVAASVDPTETIFVLDGSVGQAAGPQAEAFSRAVEVGSVIVTKLDGHAKGGGALSAVAATQSPITFIGTGEHMTDLEPFVARSFVSRLLGMGDLPGLLSRMEGMDHKKQEKMVADLLEGKRFTFRQFRDQFQTLLKMGPLGQVMSMIPGMSNLMGGGREEESMRRIKAIMTMLDSFTAKELDSDTKLLNLQRSRIIRIARGSGHSVASVEGMMAMFKPFQKVAEKLKGVMGRGGQMDPRKLQGAQGARNLQQMFDPRILQQMGGMQGIQRLMSQMGGMGGPGGGGMPPGMAEMMARMGGGGMPPGMGGRGGGGGRRGKKKRK